MTKHKLSLALFLIGALAIAIHAQLVVTPSSSAIAVGQTVQLSSTGGSGVKWTTSQPNVATVNSVGLVTGLTSGTATITAKRANQSGQATVTVNAPPPPPPPPLPDGALFYVDPDYPGSQMGSTAMPWNALDSAAWAVINNALPTTAVTVYFSGRAATTDANQIAIAALTMARTDTSSNRLTLDGHSYYNTDDAAPVWSVNPGTRQFQIMTTNPVAPLTSGAQSNITLRGFRLIATEGQIVFWWGGDNLIVEDNELSSSAGATYGPGLYFGYTQEEGLLCPLTSLRESCTVFSNLTIRRNYIHDTFGEGIYIGGCANHAGCVSHNGVLIEGNTLRNIATLGGQGDAIDLKDGLRNVIVRGNDVRLQDNSHDGIVTESGALIEQNYLEHCGHTGISFSAYWNDSAATRAGTVARNNLIVDTGGNTADVFSMRAGIYTDEDATGDAYSDLKLYNNTIYRVMAPVGSGSDAFGIRNGAVGTTLTNNVVSEVGGYPLRALTGTLVSAAHNLFFTSGSTPIVVFYGAAAYTTATIMSFDATTLAVDPQFVSISLPYALANFTLSASSPARGAGVAISSFDNDIVGALRRTIWDMGAIQSTLSLAGAR